MGNLGQVEGRGFCANALRQAEAAVLPPPAAVPAPVRLLGGQLLPASLGLGWLVFVTCGAPPAARGGGALAGLCSVGPRPCAGPAGWALRVDPAPPQLVPTPFQTRASHTLRPEKPGDGSPPTRFTTGAPQLPTRSTGPGWALLCRVGTCLVARAAPALGSG